jgi:hypothetical protein
MTPEVRGKVMIRHGLAITLTVVMLFTATVLPAHGGIAGDTNGDCRVDVRDLQRIIAQVLAQEAYDPRADVNRDGRVDILDFQQVLDRAHDKAQSETPAPTKDAVPVVRAEAPVLMPMKAPILFFTPGKRVTTAALRARSVPMRPSSAKVERYTLRLTPNAPPAQVECVCSAV